MMTRLTSFDRLEKVRPDGAPGRPVAGWLTPRAWMRRSPLWVCAAAILLSAPACLICAMMVDVPLARWAQGLSPRLRGVAQVFSDFGLSSYMLILSGLVVLASYAMIRRDRTPDVRPLTKLVGERALFVFAAVGLSGIAVQILKHVVGRARPGLIDRFGAFYFDHFSLKASLASFPSGHATSIFALAAALSLIAPRLRWPLFGLAILVGVARGALAAHYASDILAGAIFGVVMTYCTACMFADRSIAFVRVGGEVRLKGRGMILFAIRSRGVCSRAGA